MKNRDWLLTNEGNCLPCATVKEWNPLREDYRFYRFLTEVEDVLNKAQEQGDTEDDFNPTAKPFSQNDLSSIPSIKRLNVFKNTLSITNY